MISKNKAVLIPSVISKKCNIKLKLTKSQKLNIIRYGLKYIYIKYIK